MPTDTSIDTNVDAGDRPARALPAGAGVVIAVATGTLMWGGLLALILI